MEVFRTAATLIMIIFLFCHYKHLYYT